MTAIAGAIMVGSAGLCLGGALHARKLLGIAAATVMLCAMIDLAYFQQISPVLWAGLLVVAAMFLGLGLRLASGGIQHNLGGRPNPGRTAGGRSESVLNQTGMIASVLAYPAAAWLTLTHNHGESGASSGAANATAEHAHGSGGLFSTIPSLAIAGLVLTLAAMSILAFRRRRTGLVVESSGMAAMLAVMLL